MNKRTAAPRTPEWRSAIAAVAAVLTALIAADASAQDDGAEASPTPTEQQESAPAELPVAPGDNEGAAAAAAVDAGAEANVVAAAAEFARPRCVKIYGAGAGRERGYATGVLVSEAGHILTAQGIYLAGARLRVVTADGRVHEAKIVRRDQGLQMALLKIDARTPRYFEIEEAPAVKTGDWVVAVSNAFNVADAEEEPLSVMLGIASLRGELETRKRAQDFDVATEVLLVDAIVANPGAPGGAVVTPDGRLAGVVGKILEAQTTNTRLNYAIPNDLLARFLAGESFDPDADAQARAGEPYLGIRIFKLSGRKAPAYIDRVRHGSPADEAGLRTDDLILSINGQWVRSVEEYEDLFEDLRPGEQIRMTLKRGREVLAVRLTVAKDE